MKVTVNEKVFNEQQCMQQIQRLSYEKPGLSEKDAKKEIADDIVKHTLLREYATKEINSVPVKAIESQLNQFKEQFPSENEFQNMCKKNHVTEDIIKSDIKESIRVDMFVKQLAKNIPPAPKKVIEEYYKRDLSVSTKAIQIHAAHIVKQITPQTSEKIYAEMCDIRKKLLDGADFSKIADSSSSCNDAGGDLGFFSRGKMVEEFDVIAFSMNPGEVSPIFQTQFGYHIATVYEIKKAERLSLEECVEDIKIAIQGKMQEECVKTWIDKVKLKAKIKIEN